MVVTCIGLLFAVLNRAKNPKARFIMVPAVTYPLLALGVLVVITAVLWRGAGFASLVFTVWREPICQPADGYCGLFPL